MGENNNIMGGTELGFSPMDNPSILFEDSPSLTEESSTSKSVEDTQDSISKKAIDAPSLSDDQAAKLFNEEENNNSTDSTDSDPNGIFGKKEVVGGEQSVDKASTEDGSDSNVTVEAEGSTSPEKSQIYSATLALMKEQGALPSLDDETINTVDTPEAFSEVISKYIDSEVDSRMDEETKRIKEALNAGLEPEEIQYYEQVSKSLEGITDETLEDDTDAGVKLRKDLIYQDFINRGFSEQRAQREVEKSISNGTDVEDAKDALESNKEFFRKRYESILEEGKLEAKKFQEENEKRVKAFKDEIDSTNEFLSGIKIDTTMKAKIKDAVLKPKYKTEDGRMISEVQKFSMDNPVKAQAIFATMYAITNGFKDMNKISKTVSKRAASEASKKLAAALNNNGSDSSARFNNPFDIEAPSASVGNKGYRITLD